MLPYQVVEPTSGTVPIVLSVPHCGLVFPDEIKSEYKAGLVTAPDDTDWYVQRLYDFAPAMGITLVYARYSRWVIDLNRNPADKPLYTDGRLLTSLCPTTTFLGEPIYNDGRKEVLAAEVNRRLATYFTPYHQKIGELLQQLSKTFGQVLLWDCHSIRQSVPTIHAQKFPDFILGDADGTTASPGLIELASSSLESAGYSFSHNVPFKGGYITRHFGKPAVGQHALQLEMTKINYMDDTETRYDHTRADRMRNVLMRTFDKLAAQLRT
jgi:N-formylglutamate amidohydrolase